MNNYNDFVPIKNEKIVFCQDGRIFLIDKDTELVDLRDCENCKQKDQRIAELEKLLAEKDKLLENAIVPKSKFKVGQEVYFIVDKKIRFGEILKYSTHRFCNFVYSITGGGCNFYAEENIFKTKKEAEEALKKEV